MGERSGMEREGAGMGRLVPRQARTACVGPRGRRTAGPLACSDSPSDQGDAPRVSGSVAATSFVGREEKWERGAWVGPTHQSLSERPAPAGPLRACWYACTRCLLQGDAARACGRAGSFASAARQSWPIPTPAPAHLRARTLMPPLSLSSPFLLGPLRLHPGRPDPDLPQHRRRGCGAGWAVGFRQDRLFGETASFNPGLRRPAHGHV